MADGYCTFLADTFKHFFSGDKWVSTYLLAPVLIWKHVLSLLTLNLTSKFLRHLKLIKLRNFVRKVISGEELWYQTPKYNSQPPLLAPIWLRLVSKKEEQVMIVKLLTCANTSSFNELYREQHRMHGKVVFFSVVGRESSRVREGLPWHWSMVLKGGGGVGGGRGPNGTISHWPQAWEHLMKYIVRVLKKQLELSTIRADWT
jgi:hypothetical protein